MAAIVFPSNPADGQIFIAAKRAWFWNGRAWQGFASDAIVVDGADLNSDQTNGVISVDAGNV